MALFKDRLPTDVITPEDIKALTGITPNDIRYINQMEKEEQEQAFNELLSTWINRISAHIELRLGTGEFEENSSEYLAMQDIIIRTVSRLVALSQQMQSSPIVRIGDFAVGILDTADVISSIETELAPFLHLSSSKKGSISFFSSLTEEDLNRNKVNYNRFYWYRIGNQGEIQGAYSPNVDDENRS